MQTTFGLQLVLLPAAWWDAVDVEELAVLGGYDCQNNHLYGEIRCDCGTLTREHILSMAQGCLQEQRR